MHRLFSPVHTSGFTLLEILIAMVILGIAFTGLCTLQLSCSHGLRSAQYLSTAVILAQDKMETLKGLHPDHPDLRDTKPGNNGTLWQSIDQAASDHYEDTIPVREADTQPFPPGIYTLYTRSWNVADNTPIAGKKTVVVTVHWKPDGKRVAVFSVL